MLGKTAAVVIGSFPLGESDRIVTFYSRDFGKIRGVAKSARRMRSRFGSALELCTLGELVFFDGGRSELVRIDHFDITRPFDRVREDLDRLAQAAWMIECVARLTGERDRHVAIGQYDGDMAIEIHQHLLVDPKKDFGKLLQHREVRLSFPRERHPKRGPYEFSRDAAAPAQAQRSHALPGARDASLHARLHLPDVRLSGKERAKSHRLHAGCRAAVGGHIS